MNPLEFLAATGELVLRASVQGLLLAGVVVMLQRFLRGRLGPAWTFALWFLVLARLSTPMLPASNWSWQRLGFLVQKRGAGSGAVPAAPVAAGNPEPRTPVAAAGGFVATVTDLPGTPPDPVVEPAGALPPAEPGEDAADAAPWPWAAVGGGIWAGMTAVLLAIRTVRVLRFRRRVAGWPELSDATMLALARECADRMGIRGAVLRVVPGLAGPCVFGVLRPTLLVPAHLVGRLADREWRDILSHEFAHVRRLDPLWDAWMSVLLAVHWFNPVLPWAVRRMRVDRELACDELALRGSAHAERRSYGTTLLRLAAAPVDAFPTKLTVGIVEDADSLRTRLMALDNPPGLRRHAAFGMAVLAALGTVALTTSPQSGRAAPLQAVDLSGQVDYPKPMADAVGGYQYQDNPQMWRQIPKGRQVIQGIPFEIRGLIRLAGLGSRRDEWYFRPRVDGIPVGRSFARLYLLHATFYYADPGATIATARLNYEDGSTADVPIRYGEHTLNYWRNGFERVPQPTHTGSRVAWTGDGSFLAEYGNSLRLCVSSLHNPRPSKVVRSIDLVSAQREASEVVVGMATGGSDLPKAWRSAARVRKKSPAWKSKLRFRALDADSGKPIAGMTLRVEVADEGIHARILTRVTGADGRAVIEYPHPRLRYVSIWADHAGHVPRFLQWTRSQHGDFPAEWVYRAHQGKRLGGVVEDADGNPVSGALVRIDGPAPDFAGDAKEFLVVKGLFAETDAHGNWSTAAVPGDLRADQLRLQVLHPRWPGPVPFAATPAGMAGGAMRITLPRPAVISGAVVDPEGNPVAGARVVVWTGILSVAVTVGATDAAGNFRLQAVSAPNPSTLEVSAPGFAPHLAALRTEPPWDPGQSPIVLSRGHPLRIQVRDADGRPVPDALIEARTLQGTYLPDQASTDAAGVATWQRLPDPGKEAMDQYQFLIHGSGFPSAMPRIRHQETNVAVTLAGRIETLAAKVVDAGNGRPVPLFKLWSGRKASRPFEPFVPADPDAKVEWDAQPVAVGHDGRIEFHAMVSDPGRCYRFDAPGYGPSAEMSEASLRQPAWPVVRLSPR